MPVGLAGFLGGQKRVVSSSVRNYLWIQSQGFKLPPPFWRSIVQSLDLSRPIKTALSTSTVVRRRRRLECIMLNDRENILSALREKPLKVYEIMKRANVVNEEACQSLLLKMTGEGLVKFDIHKGRWLIG